MKNNINKEQVFNSIKRNGCKCYLYGNKKDLTQADLVQTIEKNKNNIINGKMAHSFYDIIKDAKK